MAKKQYDITIIGGGSAGLTAARLAASLGANVLLVDKERLGGDCLYYGCVPSKSLIHAARVAHQVKHAARLGLGAGDLHTDMAKVTAYVHGVIQKVGQTEAAYTENVTVTFGKISLQSPTRLQLNDESIKSRTTLIATGSHPAIPEVAGLKETGFWTNEDVFDLMHLPNSIIIVGGGPVGVELSQAFARLGIKVTLIQGPERILPKEDPEVSNTVAAFLMKEGIAIITSARFVKAGRKEHKKEVIVEKEGQPVTFEADEIVLALGRRPNVEGLNLEEVGVKYDTGGIKVNDFLQTSVSNIFALGDVVGGYLFTHVAAYQAGIAVRNALVPLGKKKVDYRVVPWCTFTDPEVARVGLTPSEAEEQHKRTRMVKFPLTGIDRAQAEDETTGFIKLVLAGKKDEIVGFHMVGAHAGELLGEMALAMRHHLTLNDIMATIHTYPTMDTGIQQAAFDAYLGGAPAALNRKVVRALLHLHI